MFEEPFRWMEAISTRHSYVQEKLKKGQPVLAVPYDQGALLMGFTSQPGKIFEVYDRIAMGALGHPADVEKLRMNLLDMAHVEGFSRSSQDVTTARLLQFGIAPALKQNFEEVMRAPYLIQMLLVEINPKDETIFFRLNYDGYWETLQSGGVIAGNNKVMESIQAKIEAAPFKTYPLQKALKEACLIWEQGLNDGKGEDAAETKPNESPANLKAAFEKWTLETAVLCHDTSRKSLYRPLSAAEIEQIKASILSS
jgi:proteasome alpha subunit